MSEIEPINSGSIEDVLGVQYDALKPEVKEYVDHLRCQIRSEFQEYGASDYERFKAMAVDSPTTIPQEVIQNVQKRLVELQRIITNNEVPKSNLVFSVERGLDPDYEVMVDNVPGTEPGKISYDVNLNDFLLNDRPAYAFAGLEEWSRDIPETLDAYYFTPTEREAILEELTEGAIPIFMPSARVQLATIERIGQLKPVYFEGGLRIAVLEASRKSQMQELVDRRHPSLVANVPDVAYLLLMKPTRRPLPETTNMRSDDQKKLLAEYQKSHPYHFCCNPSEYLALQHRFTHRAHILLSAHAPITKISPLDYATSSRFLDLPVGDMNRIVDVLWDSHKNCIAFEQRGGHHKSKIDGFRMAMRVPLRKR